MSCLVSESLQQVYLVRHGATDWSVAGKHTGRTDIPLNERGREQATALQARLRGLNADVVLTSPLARARGTAVLAGFAERAEVDADLAEWDYGAFEGLRTAEIRAQRADWDLFDDGCPDGENVDGVAARADRVIARVRAMSGNAMLFAHRDILGVIAARWVGWPAIEARRLYLEAASLSVLSYDHGSLAEPILCVLNDYEGPRN
jgi:probable phosphoglycerate mutase